MSDPSYWHEVEYETREQGEEEAHTTDGEPEPEQVYTVDAPEKFEEKRDRYMVSER